MNAQKFSVALEGKELSFETGCMARQADGAVTVRLGDTVVLAACVYAKEPRPGIPQMTPLMVDYRERTYAAGKIPGGYFKREGRPTEKEILSARLIDRPIRPLFPDGLANEVQVTAIVLSADAENDPDILSVIATSAALSISEIPFDGPIGAVRLGLLNDKFVVFPSFKELEECSLDLVVVGTKNGVIMLEAGANQVSDEKFYEAVEFGYQKVLELIKFQEEVLVKSCGRAKAPLKLYEPDKDLVDRIKSKAMAKLSEAYMLDTKEKRQEAREAVANEVLGEFVTPESRDLEPEVKAILAKLEKMAVRELILKQKRRVDGRKIEDIRPITCEVGFLPRTHGSGLFTRGQTQSLSVVTLGTSADEQMIDSLQGDEYKNFMLHYNFPSFSVGEVRPPRGPGRREIGHGALAERALKSLMPDSEGFPYTVRIVSDILESNGSSSMATVCGSTLALMDAGVPIKAPQAGIAIGLVKQGGDYILLTDIAGVEDFFGDMDFKVAGTEDGITAVQMDLKIDGITLPMVREILQLAKDAKSRVLKKMLETIAGPRQEMSPYAPRIVTLTIRQERIKDLIGPGGKNIKKIIEETGATIDVDNDGTVNVASADGAALNRALEAIKGLTAEAEVGKIYKGTVKKVMDFGAFCEILPNREGLCHVSELSHGYVKKVSDEVKVGDEVTVKVIGIDDLGRVNLSIKQATPKPEGLDDAKDDRGKGPKKDRK